MHACERARWCLALSVFFVALGPRRSSRARRQRLVSSWEHRMKIMFKFHMQSECRVSMADASQLGICSTLSGGEGQKSNGFISTMHATSRAAGREGMRVVLIFIERDPG